MSVIASFHDSRLYSRLRDCRYLWRNRARRRFYRAFVPRGSLVFDIGANVGHYALLFRSLGARVVAVEPQAALVARLAHRFGAGNARVRIEHCALGSVEGEAVLHKTADLTEVASLRPDIARASRFAVEHPYTGKETVPVLTLDRLIARHGTPGFCKIDVEGFEHEVLAGLGAPLPAISFEFNREFLDVTEDCLGLLEKLGPYRFNHVLGEGLVFASPRWLDASSLRAALRASPDPLLWGDIYARLP